MRLLIQLAKDFFQGKPTNIRSPKWHKVRKEFLKLNNSCAACGKIEKLEVHHIKPFHINPLLELDFNNLITLCESNEKCHLTIGHHGDWRNENPNVIEEARKKLSTISKR